MYDMKYNINIYTHVYIVCVCNYIYIINIHSIQTYVKLNWKQLIVINWQHQYILML